MARELRKVDYGENCYKSKEEEWPFSLEIWGLLCSKKRPSLALTSDVFISKWENLFTSQGCY